MRANEVNFNYLFSPPPLGGVLGALMKY